MLGACTFPLGILLTGAMMADQVRQLHPARATGTLIWSAIFRLGVIPALMLGIVRILPCSVEIKRVIVVQAAMPAGIFQLFFPDSMEGIQPPPCALWPALPSSA